MQKRARHETVRVQVGLVQVGGGAPVVVQSMANTDTADVASTTRQCIELAKAGSELVRVTVNVPEAAQAVPEIKKRMHGDKTWGQVRENVSLPSRVCAERWGQRP
jgi:(E)-4-hydroxy-3-methylbut-2-enyl-diphosphate synthase